MASLGLLSAWQSSTTCTQLVRPERRSIMLLSDCSPCNCKLQFFQILCQQFLQPFMQLQWRTLVGPVLMTSRSMREATWSFMLEELFRLVCRYHLPLQVLSHYMLGSLCPQGRWS